LTVARMTFTTLKAAVGAVCGHMQRAIQKLVQKVWSVAVCDASVVLNGLALSISRL
jgi:hypothetical protein